MDRLPAAWLSPQGTAFYALRGGWLRAPSLGWSALTVGERACAAGSLRRAAWGIATLLLGTLLLVGWVAPTAAVGLRVGLPVVGTLLFTVFQFGFFVPMSVWSPLLRRARRDPAWFSAHCARWLAAHHAQGLGAALPPAGPAVAPPSRL